jgi:hypothetical protein
MKQSMKRFTDFRTWMLLAAAMCLAACAQLGIPAADTFNKKLAAGYVAVGAVAEAANNAVVSGALSKSDAKNVLASAEAAVQGLDLASTMSKTDMAGASTRLDLTIAAITALQTYLISKGAH